MTHMAYISVAVCDDCAAFGKGDPSAELTHWQVRSEAYVAAVDLCDQHSEPLRHILALAGVRTPENRPERRDFHLDQLVTTMEELELKKSEYLAQRKGSPRP